MYIEANSIHPALTFDEIQLAQLPYSFVLDWEKPIDSLFPRGNRCVTVLCLANKQTVSKPSSLLENSNEYY